MLVYKELENTLWLNCFPLDFYIFKCHNYIFFISNPQKPSTHPATMLVDYILNE